MRAASRVRASKRMRQPHARRQHASPSTGGRAWARALAKAAALAPAPAPGAPPAAPAVPVAPAPAPAPWRSLRVSACRGQGVGRSCLQLPPIPAFWLCKPAHARRLAHRSFSPPPNLAVNRRSTPDPRAPPAALAAATARHAARDPLDHVLGRSPWKPKAEVAQSASRSRMRERAMVRGAAG